MSGVVFEIGGQSYVTCLVPRNRCGSSAPANATDGRLQRHGQIGRRCDEFGEEGSEVVEAATGQVGRSGPAGELIGQEEWARAIAPLRFYIKVCVVKGILYDTWLYEDMGP